MRRDDPEQCPRPRGHKVDDLHGQPDRLPAGLVLLAVGLARQELRHDETHDAAGNGQEEVEGPGNELTL